VAVNATNKGGSTPLRIAERNGHHAVVAALVAKGGHRGAQGAAHAINLD
jgi:ankyrin repeat protein